MILLILAFDDNVLLGTIGGENVVLHESISLLLSMQLSGLLSWIFVFSKGGQCLAVLVVLGVVTSQIVFIFVPQFLFLLLEEDDDSCGEDEEECGGVDVLLLDNERRDNGRI